MSTNKHGNTTLRVLLNPLRCLPAGKRSLDLKGDGISRDGGLRGAVLDDTYGSFPTRNVPRFHDLMVDICNQVWPLGLPSTISASRSSQVSSESKILEPRASPRAPRRLEGKGKAPRGNWRDEPLPLMCYPCMIPNSGGNEGTLRNSPGRRTKIEKS